MIETKNIPWSGQWSLFTGGEPDVTPQSRAGDAGELMQDLKLHMEGARENSVLISPAVYNGKPYRSDANVDKFGPIIAVDLDHFTAEQIASLSFEWSAFAAIWHTTKRHTDATPRWRVLLFTDRGWPVDRHAQVRRWINSEVQRITGIPPDTKCDNPSRFFFAPPGHGIVRYNDGELISIEYVFSASPTTERAAPDNSDKTDTHATINEGERDDTLYKIACKWRGLGACKKAIIAQLESINAECCKPPLPAADIERIAVSASKHKPNPEQKGPAHKEPELIYLSDVQRKRVSWLWPKKIPEGRLSVLCGDPGGGKSHISLDIAARITRGIDWPDGAKAGPIGSVVILGAEDDLEDTVGPRLDAACADSRRVVAFSMIKIGDGTKRMFSLEADLPELDKAISSVPDCRLVIIDPISAYMGGTDSHNNAEVRSLLHPLGELAQRHKVAVLAITHLNKSGGAQAMYRATGSLAFVAAARSVWIACRDPHNADNRLFLPIKCNLAPDKTGINYKIVPSAYDEETAVTSWGAVTDQDADEILSIVVRKPKSDAAGEWLTDKLMCGPQLVSDLEAAAKLDGLKWKTVKDVSYTLGVKKTKVGLSDGWEWSLPEND